MAEDVLTMKNINWDNLKEHEVAEGLHGKFVHSETMSVVRWRFEAGAGLPLHSHPNEQITVVLEGRLRLDVGGEEHVLETGDVLPIRGDVEHGGEALEDSVVLDIFHPMREDLKEKFG